MFGRTISVGTSQKVDNITAAILKDASGQIDRLIDEQMYRQIDRYIDRWIDR